MKAMILAAGFGERLRPLTDKTPKPLLQVGDKPLIQHHLDRLAQVGLCDVVINTCWLGDQIESFLGNGANFGVDIAWSREAEPLETGGGIRRALPLLGSDPFVLINGDVWTDYPLEQLAQQRWPEEIDAHLILVSNPEHHPRGDFSLDNNDRVGYPLAGEDAYTFSGISVMRPEIFSRFNAISDKFPLRDVLASSIHSGCVHGEIYSGEWWDIGTVQRLHALNKKLAETQQDTSLYST